LEQQRAKLTMIFKFRLSRSTISLSTPL